jgi:RnfABCDGE-type electron transport complex G subunit
VKPFRELLFMIVLTTICTVLLVGAESAFRRFGTADRDFEREAVLLYDAAVNADAAPPAFHSTKGKEIADLFQSRFRHIRRRGMGGLAFISRQHPDMMVRVIEGPGWGGKIRLMVMADLVTHKIFGVRILHHSEAPGLGAAISEERFFGQFSGLLAPQGVRIVPFKSGDGEIDGITGATVSARAVVKLVNQVLAESETRKKRAKEFQD